MLSKECAYCGKTFYKKSNQSVSYFINKAKYCSKSCSAYGNKSFYKYWEGKNREDITGKNSTSWKGNRVGYNRLHRWLREVKGYPKVCVDCGATSDEKRIEWSNIDHKHNRVQEEYVGRCVSCHRKYDYRKGFVKIRKGKDAPHYGKKHTEATKRRISKKMKGIKRIW